MFGNQFTTVQQPFGQMNGQMNLNPNTMGNQFSNCMPNQFMNQNNMMMNNNMMNNNMMMNNNVMMNNNGMMNNNMMMNNNIMMNNNGMMNNNMMMNNMMMNNMLMNQFPNTMGIFNNNMNFMNNMNGMNLSGNNMNLNNLNNVNDINVVGNDVNNFNNNNIVNNQIEQQKQAEEVLKKQEAEARRKLFSEIINKESGENLDKINTISDMASMGAITREFIEVHSQEHPEKYMPTPQALNSPDQDFFILGVVSDYLNKQGVVTAIEKRDPNPLSKEKLKEIDTFLQFLINGLTNLKKHELRFDFGWEKNNLILSDPKDQQAFMDELKVSLSKGFNIKTNEIIITYPRSGSVLVTVIFLSEDFNNITVNKVQSILATHSPDYNNLLSIDSRLVLDGILLNPELLDHKGDNKNQGWGQNEQRGGRPYYPPKGWIGYGLKVWGKYDKGNNNWISYNGVAGEWCVAYHGASQKLNNNYQMMRDVEDQNHPGQKVGEGVYCSPNPNVLDQEGGVVQVGGKKYKIGFMLRVKPDKIRIAKTNNDYWVLNGTSDEIRPYRILIKQLN